MKELDKKFKRKIGAVVMLGIFMALMLAQPVATVDVQPTYIDMDDDEWIGLGATEGRIVFDNQTTDEIEILDARLGIGDTSPDFKLEVTGSSGSGYFGVTLSSDGDVFIIDSSGNVGIAVATPMAKAHIVQTAEADAFRVDDDGNENTPFVIDKDGNVGIGVASPADKLEIDGNIRFNSGSNRKIYVEKVVDSNNGHSLTIEAGNARSALGAPYRGGDLVLHAGAGEGNQFGAHGGDVYIWGGAKGYVEGYDGDVILAHTGSVAQGNVGIGTATPDDKFEIEWASAVDVEIGRGTTDTDITFIRLRNEDGEICYIYPNADQNGILVSGTHP